MSVSEEEDSLLSDDDDTARPRRLDAILPDVAALALDLSILLLLAIPAICKTIKD